MGVDKQRIKNLDDICDQFEILYCENTDTETATVVSASKLDGDKQLEIAKQIQRLTGRKNIKLVPKVDESLLGGFVIKFGKRGPCRSTCPSRASSRRSRRTSSPPPEAAWAPSGST